MAWPPKQIIYHPASLGAIRSPADTVLFYDSARLVRGQLQSTRHGCPPSRGESCFHARHNEGGNVVWADGHVNARRPGFFERPGRSLAEAKAHRVGDLDRDGDPRTDELWDLE